MEEDPHPLGESISEKFDVSYEKVLTWYCSDFPFEDILLALQTSNLSDATPEELLIEIKTKSWEEVWDELGLSKPPDQ